MSMQPLLSFLRESFSDFKVCMLGRHFGCRPLDPTLDIWSNFMKREKKHFTSFFENQNCCKGFQGLPRVTKGYQGLPKVTKSFHRLPQVNTGSYPIFFIKKDTTFFVGIFFSFAYAWVISPDSSISHSIF